eukprot:6991846-Lingulodinium_polyedra.AAC.1
MPSAIHCNKASRRAKQCCAMRCKGRLLSTRRILNKYNKTCNTSVSKCVSDRNGLLTAPAWMQDCQADCTT